MSDYIINCNTIALIPFKEDKTRVIEVEKEFIVDKSTMNIIKLSCEFFGSSYIGRHEGTKKLTGISIKSPIIVEETRDLIYFPTMSPRLHNCEWMALKYINSYINENGRSKIFFDNGKSVVLDISYESFDNQVLRASKLESALRKRKQFI